VKVISIEKVRKNKYKLIFDNKDNLILYDDVIVNNSLMVNKKIDSNLLNKIYLDNKYAAVYDEAIRYINIRQRSELELKNYLIKKDYDDTIISQTISRLIEEGYIDDERFAKSFINDKLYLTKDGIHKIKKELKDYNIDEIVISNLIDNIDIEIIKDKIKKLIDKQIKVNSKYSGNILKIKILNYMINLGYDREMILEYLNDVDIDDNELVKKEYNKLYNKYYKKYDKDKLKRVITQKLYQKGYNNINIDEI
jgi:regulatory protein